MAALDTPLLPHQPVSLPEAQRLRRPPAPAPAPAPPPDLSRFCLPASRRVLHFPGRASLAAPAEYTRVLQPTSATEPRPQMWLDPLIELRTEGSNPSQLQDPDSEIPLVLHRRSLPALCSGGPSCRRHRRLPQTRSANSRGPARRTSDTKMNSRELHLHRSLARCVASAHRCLSEGKPCSWKSPWYWVNDVPSI
jgi:hypothetical protein